MKTSLWFHTPFQTDYHWKQAEALKIYLDCKVQWPHQNSLTGKDKDFQIPLYREVSEFQWGISVKWTKAWSVPEHRAPSYEGLSRAAARAWEIKWQGSGKSRIENSGQRREGNCLIQGKALEWEKKGTSTLEFGKRKIDGEDLGHKLWARDKSI